MKAPGAPRPGIDKLLPRAGRDHRIYGDNDVRLYALPSASFALLVTIQAASAASNSASLNVKATVFAACIVSATDVNFGTVTGSIAANTKTTAKATVICNKNTTYALSFVSGAGPINAVGTATVTMANGANTIPVKLTMKSASKIATGGNNRTTITGKIVAAIINPAFGTYAVVQAIYVLY